MQLGCSSSYPYQMDPKDTKNDQASPSNKGYIDASCENVNSEDYNLMCPKVGKLLQEKDCFNKGEPISEHEVNSAISILGNDINIFNENLQHKEFFNKYGCIYGSDFNIYGLISSENKDKGYKVNNIVKKQNSFVSFCEPARSRIKEERLLLVNS